MGQQPATQDAIPVLTGVKGASRRSAPGGADGSRQPWQYDGNRIY